MSAELVWIVLAGLAVGGSLGGLGGGGSILAVPALVYLLGQSVPTATTGSLVIVGTSAAVGAISHHRAGTLRPRLGLTFGVLGTVGSYLGTRAAAGLAGPVLLTAFSGLMVVVAILMIRRQRAAEGSSGSGGMPASAPGEGAHGVSWARVVGAATGVGLLTGFFGVGGGFAVVPALVLVLGLPMSVAVGTSLLVISINSATALAARFASGMATEINGPVVVGFAACAAVGSVVGARAVRRVDHGLLVRGFVVLLLAIAAYLAAVNIPALS